MMIRHVATSLFIVTLLFNGWASGSMAGSPEEMEGMLKRVVAVLEKVIDRQKYEGKEITPFMSTQIPEIGLLVYLQRIRKYLQVSDDVLLHALVVLDRLIVSTGDELRPSSVHRSLACAILVAQKYTNDEPTSNKYYARVFGVDVKGLNGMEVEFLKAVDFNVFVTTDDIARYRNMIMSMNMSKLL